MIKSVITCDHCGKEVPNTFNTRFGAMFTEAAGGMDDIHACSKEHLGFAVAKAFDIGIDGKALELIAQRSMDLRSAKDYSAVLSGKLKDLETHAATLTGLANQYKADRDSLEETCRMHSVRVIELEKQRDELLQRPDAVEVLRSLRTKGGALDFDGETGIQMLAMIDAAIASITDTTKPTKPARAEGAHVHEVGSCTQKPFFDRVEALLVDWEGLLQSATIGEGFRDGVKTCVKALREEIDQ